MQLAFLSSRRENHKPQARSAPRKLHDAGTQTPDAWMGESSRLLVQELYSMLQQNPQKAPENFTRSKPPTPPPPTPPPLPGCQPPSSHPPKPSIASLKTQKPPVAVPQFTFLDELKRVQKARLENL